MQVSEEELQHIIKLSNLKIEDNKINDYLKNLDEILGFVKIVEQVNTDNVDESIGQVKAYNVFRKDEIKQTVSREDLLSNTEEQEQYMFKIPKVL